jgi:peptidoglycan-associated lipoprotein
MKKLLVLSLTCVLVLAFFSSCRKEVEQTPPPPQTQEQPKVEKVEKPPAEEPELTEEEIFAQKSLEELNAEKPLEMIHFDFDEYTIRDDQETVLQDNAQWLKKWESARVLIEGHCDERGTEEYNLALGEKRAKAVQDFLISMGIDVDRMETISYGKSQPLDPGHNETAWAKNRRAEFTVIEK